MFTFPPLNVTGHLGGGGGAGGKGVRQWMLVWGIFGQKQTDAFS